MPESVLRPAPVSTTTRPSSRSPRCPVTCSATRVTHLGPGAGLGGLFLAVLGRSVGAEPFQQSPGGCLDLGDCLVEGFLVGLGRLAGTADLADVLQRRCVHLVPGG